MNLTNLNKRFVRTIFFPIAIGAVELGAILLFSWLAWGSCSTGPLCGINEIGLLLTAGYFAYLVVYWLFFLRYQRDYKNTEVPPELVSRYSFKFIFLVLLGTIYTIPFLIFSILLLVEYITS